MKVRTLFVIMSILTLTSCIKDEAPNSEADITACSIPSDLLLRDPVITNNKITLYVNNGVDISNLSPQFTLTDGATISPASGTALNFSTPQTYTVTSQDGQWKKIYTVECTFSDPVTQYHFEDIKYYKDPSDDTKQYFQIFNNTGVDGSPFEWGSGNAGFMITHSDAAATDYPTTQEDNGYIGKCAKLTTSSTGELGAMFGAPIAAGSLFIGTFEVDLFHMEKSTHFGVPFRYVPKELAGYYKYKAGDKYTDAKMNEIAGKKDIFDIYAIFFEVTDPDVPYLDGSNSLTSDNIVSMARLTDKKETDTWTHFVIPFQLINGKTIDPEKLKNGKYSMSIIMSSSIDGAFFNGAVGSTLRVDEMQLFYESANN